MKTMVEKVAQASWETWRKSKEEEGDPRATMFTFDDAWNGPEREFCIAHARACIEAMREPTNDQANEYFKIRKECGDINATACFNVSVWESMIAAALAEPQP